MNGLFEFSAIHLRCCGSLDMAKDFRDTNFAMNT